MTKIGDTITLVTGSGVEHLYFIIGKHGDRFLLVNATSYKKGKDSSSCILDQKDHPFIQHKTIVNYGDTLDSRETTIERNISSGLSRKLAQIDKKVLSKIVKNALSSEAFPGKYRCYIS